MHRFVTSSRFSPKPEKTVLTVNISIRMETLFSSAMQSMCVYGRQPPPFGADSLATAARSVVFKTFPSAHTKPKRSRGKTVTAVMLRLLRHIAGESTGTIPPRQTNTIALLPVTRPVACSFPDVLAIQHQPHANQRRWKSPPAAAHD